MASISDDFRTFINRGNLIQLAIAFVLGIAFAAVVTALVGDLISPLIGLAGHQNLSAYQTTFMGAVFTWGSFLTALISFIVIALVVFFLIALPYQRHQDRKAAKAAATTKTCPECQTTIDLKARRCPACTSILGTPEGGKQPSTA